jgi:hypothetical protein
MDVQSVCRLEEVADLAAGHSTAQKTLRVVNLVAHSELTAGLLSDLFHGREEGGGGKPSV